MPNTTTAPRQLLSAETLDLLERQRNYEDTYGDRQSREAHKIAYAKMSAQLPVALQRAQAAMPSYARRRPFTLEIRLLESVRRVRSLRKRYRGDRNQNVYEVQHSETLIQVWNLGGLIVDEHDRYTYEIAMSQDGALYFGRRRAVEYYEVIQGGNSNEWYWTPAELEDIEHLLSRCPMSWGVDFLNDFLYRLATVQHPVRARARRFFDGVTDDLRYDLEQLGVRFKERYRL